MSIVPADGVLALNGTNSDGTNGGDSIISESDIESMGLYMVNLQSANPHFKVNDFNYIL